MRRTSLTIDSIKVQPHQDNQPHSKDASDVVQSKIFIIEILSKYANQVSLEFDMGVEDHSFFIYVINYFWKHFNFQGPLSLTVARQII